MKRFLIAADGGGTKTEIVLFGPEGQITARVRASGCNPNDIGWERAQDVLERALSALLEKAGGRATSIAGVFAGVAGCISSGNKTHLQELLRRLLPGAEHIDADSDVINALSSGVGLNDGCVVIAGTGSVGFARSNGQMIRIGGWGYLFDRGGSGYDFGRDAVSASLYALDGRGPTTVLGSMIEQRLNGPLEQVIEGLYRKGRPAIAALAPLVFEAAKQKDEVACGIVDANAKELAGLMNALGRQLPQETCETVLTGSLFRAWYQLSPGIVPRLEKKHCFRFPELPPIYGSALEAMRTAGFAADETFETEFSKGLNEIPIQVIG